MSNYLYGPVEHPADEQYRVLLKCVEWYAYQSTQPDRALDTLTKIRESGGEMGKKKSKKPVKKGC